MRFVVKALACLPVVIYVLLVMKPDTPDDFWPLFLIWLGFWIVIDIYIAVLKYADEEL